MRNNLVLKPTSQKSFKRIVYGFDIETYGELNKFYCASLYTNNPSITQKRGSSFASGSVVFYNKKDLLNFIIKRLNKNSVIVATNLPFDFFGSFLDEKDNFRFLFRGSDLIYVKTYTDGKRLYPNHKKGRVSLTFLDTLNYVRMSVKEMGNILNLPKLERPRAFARLPDNDSERLELITYNIRDSKISHDFFNFLNSAFYKLGATTKDTIAQTTLSLWRNKYQTQPFFRHQTHILKEIMKGYYGGRTELFSRVKLKNHHYYDFNSLYPSCMLNELPDPNSLRTTIKGRYNLIDKYMGCSYVQIKHPYMKYPLLPYRGENKLLFPYGNWRGWYTHLELKKLIDIGGEVEKVYKTHYYTKTCLPFKDYVNELYSLRLKHKSEKSNMQLVDKLLMNSLYGKFGQKFTGRDKWTPENQISLKDLHRMGKFEVIGGFVRESDIETEPPAFSIPIWASYITTHARIKLWNAIKKSKPAYVDTDSLITKHEMEDSRKLGSLKEECFIKEGYFVKPKMYAMDYIEDGERKTNVKIKGCGMKMEYGDFVEFLETPIVKYKKMVKFKESLRRKLVCNQIIDITKEYGLEDNKREWQKLDLMSLRDSKPLQIQNI